MARLCAVAMLATLVLATGAMGQQVHVIHPGDGDLNAERMEPFEAVYSQMGFPMHVRLSREATGGGWSFTMEMAGPRGTAVDHVGHRADLSFAYRRFGFGAFRDEYLEATATVDSLVLLRMPRTVEDTPPLRRAAQSLPQPVLDGTFMYWALGLLEPRDQRVAFRVWGPTADGVEVRLTSELRSEPTSIELPDGAYVDGRVYEANTEGGVVRMLVTSTPPYLIRQEIVAPDGSATPIIELESVQSSSPPEGGQPRQAP